MANDLTTIQIDMETRDKLKEIAVMNQRTKAGQLRWMVNTEYEKLFQLKQLAPVVETGKEKKSGVKS